MPPYYMPLQWQTFIPLLIFTLVASITPGPNNTMLAASGLNHGLRRTMPHIWGVEIGFVLMVGLIGLGLGQVFISFPVLYTILRYVSGAYLLWLAWKISTAGDSQDSDGLGRPLGFFEAAAFQWVNPKAWVMAVGIVSTYTPHAHFYTNLLIACLICAVVGLPCTVSWAIFGAVMRSWFKSPTILRTFNVVMAVLLVLSLYPLLLETRQS